MGVSRGARDSVSAVYRFLPGTCRIVYVKRSNRSRNLRTRGGKLSRCLVPSRGTRGL